MKILVIGAEGQVGTFLLRELAGSHQVSGTSMNGVDNLPGLDIRDAGATKKYISEIRPQHVLLTAALTNVDQCEMEPALAEAINVQGAENIARACKAVDAGLTFFSSEYVFNGQAGPYSEEDSPEPESVYGRTKLAGEKVVAALLENHLIIRTTVVFSYLPGSLNFFMQLLNRASRGVPFTVPDDQIGNPTQAQNLAQALGELIETGCTGIYNLVGTTRIGRYDFAKKALDKLGYDPGMVKPVTTAELKQKARRPLVGGLKTGKAQAVLKSHKLWNLATALDHTMEQMKTG